MKPLHVALCYRPTWYRKARIDGQFAYPVPEFTWTAHHLNKTFRVGLAGLKADAVFWDEGKHGRTSAFFPAKGHRRTPVMYYSLYPTLARHIFQDRVARAKRQADLVLLDHDAVKRWQREGLKARRLAYSVNENYYFDDGGKRHVDVGFYCVWCYNPARPAMDAWLEDICKRKGWQYATTRGRNVGESYAGLLRRTKVVVHLNRTNRTRPPRIFDCAASGTALLSNPMPAVTGEQWISGQHYVAFQDPHDTYTEPLGAGARGPFTDGECEEVIQGLEWLLDQGHWEEVAANAKKYVLANHTWATRAKQLRAIIYEELGR